MENFEDLLISVDFYRISQHPTIFNCINGHLAGAVEYTNYISAEG